MTPEREKAEKYVREKLPELMELHHGCEFRFPKVYGPIHKVCGAYVEGEEGEEYAYAVDYMLFNGDFAKIKTDEIEILGHAIHLQHWLRVIADELHENVIKTAVHFEKYHVLRIGAGTPDMLCFNLTTGQPAAEADYKAFNTLTHPIM